MSTAKATMETLRRAIEKSDFDLLMTLYADDAEVRIVDKRTQPSKPLELRGKKAIGDFYRDVCGRAMTHRVENEVVGDDRLAFTEACHYPDGCNVLVATVRELRAGQIVREVNVQAWDE